MNNKLVNDTLAKLKELNNLKIISDVVYEVVLREIEVGLDAVIPQDERRQE